MIWQNIVWPSGFTALHLAAEAGHAGAVELLVRLKGDVMAALLEVMGKLKEIQTAGPESATTTQDPNKALAAKYAEIFENGFDKSSDFCFKAFLRRATAYRGVHRWEDALNDLEQCLKLSPEDKDAKLLLKQTTEAALAAKAAAAARGGDGGAGCCGAFGVATRSLCSTAPPP